MLGIIPEADKNFVGAPRLYHNANGDMQKNPIGRGGFAASPYGIFLFPFQKAPAPEIYRLV